jgi:hypothetical protein
VQFFAHCNRAFKAVISVIFVLPSSLLSSWEKNPSGTLVAVASNEGLGYRKFPDRVFTDRLGQAEYRNITPGALFWDRVSPARLPAEINPRL